MKVLLFVLLAGYAVKCDDNNYYVIEMPDDLPTPKPFKVYWNVPTKQCKSKKIPFENLFEKFGIIQNENDHFIGEKVTILYDPGLFPALLKNETSGKFKFRNGGVPQEGDLNKHLETFKRELDQSIPDKNFDGIGIIDFESWRPVFRQNFGVLRPYKDVSLEIERKLHWWWQEKWLEAEAKSRFEDSARTFMQTTIAVAKQHRPRAQWGFYGFPYCFNMASNNMVEGCASNVPQENDKINWLWQESTTLFPSVYSSADLSTSQLTALIRGRVSEASRFNRQILPYFWYRYRDAGFLTEVDLNAALDTIYKSKASGFIIWGSSNDVKTVQKCNKLLNYIEKVMGPAIAKYTKQTDRRQDDISDSLNNTSTNIDDIKIYTTKASTDITTTTGSTTTESRIKELDPEYHWTPPENYTQDIKDHVAEEISKKRSNFTGTGDRNTVLDNSVLIDLILHSVLINNENKSDVSTNVSNLDSETTELGKRNDSFDELLSSTTTQPNKDLEIQSTSVTNNIAITKGEYSEVNTTNSSIIDMKTSNIGENVHSSEELPSRTTTQANSALEVESISVTIKTYTPNDKDNVQFNLETIVSSESTKSIETLTNDDTQQTTSQNYDLLDKHVMEYATTSMLPDKFTDDITDASRSKNKKKSYLQDSMENYFDVTTKILLSTETTIEITENTAVFSDFTTESNLNSSNVTNTNEVIEPSTNIANSTMKNLYNIDDSRENWQVNEIESFTTEITDFSQKPSQRTTNINKIENDISTNEPESNEQIETVNITDTHEINVKENNETLQPASKKYSENTYNSSTQAPNFKEITEVEDYFTTETQNEEETSVMPTSTSEQVSGSAPRFTRSQSIYCIIFYIYSVSKCLCSIFGQCY